MKHRRLALAITIGLLAAWAAAQDAPAPPRGTPARAETPGGREPPPQAYEDCRGRHAGDAVQHTTPAGVVAATCVDSPGGLVARPQRGRGSEPGQSATPGGAEERQTGTPSPGALSPARGGSYSLAQATSDQAQLNTIAFNGLAFLSGDFAHDTFLPPGKVSDYFGFQYLRDIDARAAGHNTGFLTRIADNMLTILNDDQRAQLLALARDQESDIRRFAEMRLPLIQAFRLNLEGKLPAGSSGLDRDAVTRYSAELYVLDGKLSYERARTMASILRSLTPAQRALLAQLKFGDSGTWPDVAEPVNRRSMPRAVNVALMTYASEMFSWQAGSVEADTYFCPERHGMYFGGFGMKTAPAMGKRDYSISTALTGNSGEAFLAVLNDRQRHQLTDLIDVQRADLEAIVGIRREIAGELRRFLKGETADQSRVLALSKRYGELDGKLSYLYASAFARIGQTLGAQQKQALLALRMADPSEAKGPFLYSTPTRMPDVGNTDRFFAVKG